MGYCEACDGDNGLSFTCNECGGTFCSEHRLPESHQCEPLLVGEGSGEGTKTRTANGRGRNGGPDAGASASTSGVNSWSKREQTDLSNGNAPGATSYSSKGAAPREEHLSEQPSTSDTDMSFKEYLVNIGVEAALGVYGVVFGFVGLGMIAMGDSTIVGVVFFVTAALSLLYMRYRNRERRLDTRSR